MLTPEQKDRLAALVAKSMTEAVPAVTSDDVAFMADSTGIEVPPNALHWDNARYIAFRVMVEALKGSDYFQAL